VPRQEFAGVHQAVLQVGAVLPLAPPQRRQLLGLDLARIERERDQVQVVARELALDQAVQRQRDLLGRQKTAAIDH
jgi:hypothetical protein